MFNIAQFRELIVKSSLNDLLLYSQEAEELLVFTCAVESQGGTFLHQTGKGPALGIYQMEPATYNDLWQNYINNTNGLRLNLIQNFDISRMPSEERLVYDLRFATAMTRIFYRRVPAALPAASDINGIWNYYKTYYNTPKGAAQKDEAIKKYNAFIAN